MIEAKIMSELDKLIAEYLQPVYRYLHRLTGEASMAEDIAQETFIKVWKNLRQYDPKRNARSWIFRIAHNTAIDHLRQKRPILFSRLEGDRPEDIFSDTLPDPAPLPDELFARAELARELESILSDLRPAEREVVTLHHDSGLTFVEISEIVGEPLNTVKSRYRRTLEKLQQALLHQND